MAKGLTLFERRRQRARAAHPCKSRFAVQLDHAVAHVVCDQRLGAVGDRGVIQAQASALGPMDPAGRPSARNWAGVARSSSRARGVP